MRYWAGAPPEPPVPDLPGSAPDDDRRRRRRKQARAVIIFAVIVIALFLILPRLAGQKHALDMLREASVPMLILAVIVETVSLIFYSLLFRRLLGLLRYPVTLTLALRINLAGLAAAHLFSAGGVGGAAVTYRVLQKRGMPHATVLIAVIFQNAFAYSVLFLLFAIGLLALLFRGQANDVAMVFAAVFVTLLFLLSLYGFWLLAHPTSLRRRGRQTVDWLGRRWSRFQVPYDVLDEYLSGIVDGWRRLRHDGFGHLRTVAFSMGYWGLDILCLLAVMVAFGQYVPVYYVLIAYGVANVVGTFSPTPGGLGAVEAVMIALLAGSGMESGGAVAVVLVYRLINFWLPIPAGLVTYTTLRKEREA
jgi:uncharacterized protein (TIRG00374 family)